MRKSLLNSKRYKDFIVDRDKALEKILQNTLIDISRITFQALDHIDKLASQLALRYSGHSHAIQMHSLSHQFDHGTKEIITQVWPLLVSRIESMRKSTYIMTYVSEQEAIGRATKEKTMISQGKFKDRVKKSISSQTILDEKLANRVWMDLVRMRHRIVQAFDLALVQELKPNEILDKVKDAFPKIKIYKRPPKALTKIREASYHGPKKIYMDFDFIDEDDWEFSVQEYKDTELDPGRFDQSADYDPNTGLITYDWELERDTTEDFVQQVRDGQIEAANDLGIKDFVWVAIIDDKTDECCIKRHGKTSQEIEEMLANGKLNAQYCDAITPPAHPNCRCNIGPVASVDEVEGPDWQSFDDWLNS